MFTPKTIARKFEGGHMETWSARCADGWRAYVLAMIRGTEAQHLGKPVALHMRDGRGQLVVIKPKPEANGIRQ